MKYPVMKLTKNNYVSGPELDVAFGVEVGPSPREERLKAFVVAIEVEGRSTVFFLASSLDFDLHYVEGFFPKWIFFCPLLDQFFEVFAVLF